MRQPSLGTRNLLRSARSIGKRYGWGVADQALSSLTNFLLGLFAARNLPAADFGAFAVVFAAYLIALGSARAVSSEPFVVRYSAASSSDWRVGASSATGSAVVAGLITGLLSVVVATMTKGTLGVGFLAVGVMLPGLLLQDTWRFTFFAARRGLSAFLNDLVWAMVLVGGMIGLMVSGNRSVGWFVTVWGGAGTVAGLFGIMQAKLLPAPLRSREWIRQQRDLIPRYLGEFSVTTVVSQAMVFGLGSIAGLAQVGIYRAGQILLGPLNVLFLGVGIVAVPEGVRALVLGPGQLLRISRWLSFFLCTCALLLGAALWSLPDDAGQALLRENWEGGRSVLVPLTFGMACFGLLAGAGVGLRSLGAARLSLRARLLVAPISLLGGLGGAALNDAVGAAWGMALAFGMGAGIWWHYFMKGLHEHRHEIVGQTVPRSDQDRKASPDGVSHG